MNHEFTTAKAAGLISCHSCHLLCESGKRFVERVCPRCGAQLHDRKPNSIARTWALVLAAFVGLCLLTGYWFSAIPTGFVPEEDQGYFLMLVELPDAATIGRTES
ncbi:MAG: hypothetical protein OET21_21310, partial [Desulfobacterales bacterium]|nr:hypothetical protein [Desulfobacterales bacterium]